MFMAFFNEIAGRAFRYPMIDKQEDYVVTLRLFVGVEKVFNHIC